MSVEIVTLLVVPHPANQMDIGLVVLFTMAKTIA